MAVGVRPLADYTKEVVFPDGRTTDTAKDTLLHPTFEFNDCGFGRGLWEKNSSATPMLQVNSTDAHQFDFDRDLANKEPR
jgi:hypothetical protein